MFDRRTVIAGAGALAAMPATASMSARPVDPAFPKGFLWGAATAGHQVEGNNVNADCWLVANVKPSAYAEPSGDANNSFELWPTDLGLVRDMGLNTYRFSLEWARIEPEQGRFSAAMLDHAPALFARFCDVAARHLAGAIGYATTLNEPNLTGKLQDLLPGDLLGKDKAMSAAAALASGTKEFRAGNGL